MTKPLPSSCDGKAETWSGADWREFDCACTRCHVALEWEGELPETADEAICHECAWAELLEVREEIRQLREALHAADAHIQEMHGG